MQLLREVLFFVGKPVFRDFRFHFSAYLAAWCVWPAALLEIFYQNTKNCYFHLFLQYVATILINIQFELEALL